MSLKIEGGKYYRDGTAGNLIEVRGPVDSNIGRVFLGRSDAGAYRRYDFNGLCLDDDPLLYTLLREVNADGSEIIPFTVPAPGQRFYGSAADVAKRAGYISLSPPVCDCGSKYNSGFHALYCSTLQGDR